MTTPTSSVISPQVSYTDIDLNTSGTTTLYDGNAQAIVTGVYLQNDGTSAVVRLEMTDGTDTAVLTPDQTAGDGIAFDGPLHIEKAQNLQANVATVEGGAQTNTAVASVDEQ